MLISLDRANNSSFPEAAMAGASGLKLTFLGAMAVGVLAITGVAIAEPIKPEVDLCAIDGSTDAVNFKADWVSELAHEIAMGGVICETQTMHVLGYAEGRTYVLYKAAFVPQDEASDLRSAMLVGEIVDSVMTPVDRYAGEWEISKLDAHLVQRDGQVFLVVADPSDRVLMRGADGFTEMRLDTRYLEKALVDGLLPSDMVAQPIDGDGYVPVFNAAELAEDIAVAVKREVYPRDYAVPGYDRDIVMRLPWNFNGTAMAIGAPEIVATNAGIVGGIGETPLTLVVPESAHSCRLSAWLWDEDINGVAVRTAPDANSALIAMLPSGYTAPGDDGLSFGAEVRIVGAMDGWFLIEEGEHPVELYGTDQDPATAPLGLGSDELRTAYRGRGWVHGSRLSTEIQSGTGLAATAAPGAAVVFDLQLSTEGNYAGVDGFLDCQGDMVKLAVTRSDGVRGDGWMSRNAEGQRLCSNQATTCS
jgi:hypothetical protein